MVQQIKENLHNGIADVFMSSAKMYEDRIAISDSYGEMSYKELDIYSSCLARKLSNLSCWDEDIVVAVDFPKGREVILLILAIYKAGGIYLPLNENYPPKRIANMMKISNSTLIIAEKKQRIKEVVEEIGCEINYIEWKDLNKNINTDIKNEAYTEFEIRKASKTAYIMFTSGSTGEPKGVVVSQQSVINSAIACHNRFFELPEDVGLDESRKNSKKILKIGLLSDFSFDPSVVQMYIALFFGNCVVPIPDDVKRSQKLLCEYWKKQNVDVCEITPTHLKYLLNFYEDKKEGLYLPNTIVSVGEPLSGEMVNNIFEAQKEANAKVINAYGPTEICVYSNAKVITKGDFIEDGRIGVGKPLSGYRVYILNKNLKEVNNGEEGEIYIGGHYLSDGYIGRDDLTKKSFLEDLTVSQDKMYKTGDLGRYVGNGEYICLGRNDDQIKISGHRIELGEVEKVFKNKLLVDEVHLLVKNDSNNEKQIVAFYTGEELEVDEAKKELEKFLPNYMVPKVIIRLESFKLNVNGKLDRNSMREAYEKYRLSTEVKIDNSSVLSICKYILEKNDLTYEDNLFEKGASSLDVFKLNTRVYNELGVALDVRELYNAKNIKEIELLVKGEAEKNSNNEKINEEVVRRVKATEIQCQLIRKEKIMRKKAMANSDDLDNNTPPYNIIHIVKHSKYIDSTRLESSIEKLIQRNKILRSIFVVEDKELYLEWKDKGIVDFSHVHNVNFENIDYYKYARNFSWNELPLLQIILFENEDKEQRMMINIHHGIFDFLSLSVFLNELFSIYYGLPIQPKKYDFFKFINDTQNSDYKKVKEFWKEYLKDRKKAVALPPKTDNVRMKIRANDTFGYLDVKYGSEDTARLKRACEKLKVSVFTMMCSAVAEIMEQATGKDDITLATVFHGRPVDYVGISEVIGLLAQIMPIRFKISKDICFEQRLIDKQKEVDEILKNQGIGMNDIYCMQTFEERLIGDYFKVMINYHTDYIQVLPNGLGELECIEIGKNPKDIPLYIQITTHKNDMTFSFMYAEKLYTEEIIKNMSDNLLKCLSLWIDKVSLC
ncbi:MAG: amino acid adenylation domain-containing protein [Clostridium sp.]|nr:amino acid adenylation domain-containing protein [Clostridium sp.]